MFRVYLDEFWLVNFFMDYAVVSIMAALLARTTTQDVRGYLVLCARKIAAAWAGSAWAVTMLTFRLTTFWGIAVTYIIICPLMAVITLWEINFKRLMQGIIATYLSAGAMGGLIYILKNYISIEHMWQLILCGTIAAGFVRYGFADAKRNRSKRQFRYPVYIEQNGKTVQLIALCDTGNSLRDPIYGREVNLVSKKSVETLLDGQSELGVHLIPYRSVGQSEGLIPTVFFDRLTIVAGKNKTIITKPLFALYSGTFGDKGDYQVILHPGMLGVGES